MALFHYNVATDGVRAGHKIFSILGFKWLTVEVIPLPVGEKPAGGGGLIYDKILPDTHYYIRVVIKINGKTITRNYKTKFADVIANISIVLRNAYVDSKIMISTANITNKIFTKLIKVKNSVVTKKDATVKATVNDEVRIKVKHD